MSADFIIAIIENDQLAQQGQQLFKQLKSRYGDKNEYSHFILGVNKGKQKYYECQDVNVQGNDTLSKTHNVEETTTALEKQVILNQNQKRNNMDDVIW